MRLRDVVLTVLDNLRRMRLKIVLTTLGVVIGTASVVLMVSIGAGMQHSIEATFAQFNIATQITVSSTGMGMPEPVANDGAASTGSRKRAKKLNDDAVREIEQVEGVVAVMPRLMVNAGSLSLGERQFGAQVYGVTPESLEEFGIVAEQGRMMTSGNEAVVGAIVPVLAVMDMEEGGTDPYAKDAPRLDMLDKRVVLEIYKDAKTPDAQSGEPETVRRKVLVTGILKSGDFMSDTSLYIPLKTARRYSDLSAKKTEYQEILVKTKSAKATEAAVTAINELGYLAQTQGGEIESVKQIFLIIQLVLGGIGGIALLVASLGIANTMTMSIYERTREIGIMKAVGASGRQIRQIFLGEAASIGLLGGVGGLLLAMFAAALGNLFLRQAMAGQSEMGNPFASGELFLISPGLALFAVVFAACIGLVAGILPAIRAANLDPLAALRHE